MRIALSREARVPDKGWAGPKQGADLRRLTLLAFTTNNTRTGPILPLIRAENGYLPGMVLACQPVPILFLP